MSRRPRARIIRRVLLIAAGAIGIAVAAVNLISDGATLPTSVESVEVALDEENPLRGDLTLRTSDPVTLSVTARTPGGDGFHVIPPREADREHRVPLLGLAPETAYAIGVDLEGPEGRASVDAGTLRTGPLPDDVPPVEAAVGSSRDGELTLFDVVWQMPGEERNGDEGYLVVVDGRGEIVWYHAEEQPIQDTVRTEAGTFLFTYNDTGAREVSPTGELVREWVGIAGRERVPDDDSGQRTFGEDAIPVGADQMHHEIAELPNGNLLTLSREVRTVDYPEAICEDEPFDGTYEVVGDTIVEFDRDTGEVVEELSLFELLDPLDNLDRTKPPDFCGQYFDWLYPGRSVRDWTHANAVTLDEDRNALIVSLRHTDSLIALRYAEDDDGPAGELLWTLGEDGDFDLVGDGNWFLHQHAPEVQPDGSILLYDNGNERPGTSLEDGPPPYSRAVQYRIDPEEGVAEQVWEHRAPPGETEPPYAPFVGDADRTDDDTVLIAHGGLLDPPSHSPGDPDLQTWARILEVERSGEEPVLDVRVKDPDEETGWRTYRADRIPSIYPAGYTVDPLPGD